jgi:hypothetical protein
MTAVKKLIETLSDFVCGLHVPQPRPLGSHASEAGVLAAADMQETANQNPATHQAVPHHRPLMAHFEYFDPCQCM